MSEQFMDYDEELYDEIFGDPEDILPDDIMSDLDEDEGFLTDDDVPPPTEE